MTDQKRRAGSRSTGQKKKRKKKKNRFAGAGVILLLLLAAGLTGLWISRGKTAAGDTVVFSEHKDNVPADRSSRKITEGITIGDVDVSGMLSAEAKAALDEDYSGEHQGKVTVHWADQSITAGLERLGVTWGVEDAVEKAVSLGYQGGIIRQYKDQTDLRIGTLHIDLSWHLDRKAVSEFVESDIAWEHDFDSVSAKLSRVDGVFQIEEDTVGRVTDQAATVEAICRAFYERTDTSDIEVNAVVNEVPPMYSAEDMRQVKDILGSMSTTYCEDDDSRTERAVNVEVGTAYIDKTVLWPGRSVSVSDLLRERTEENGYKTGAMMNQGQVEDSVGGGVCQVSTTLYNALLEAELQIDVRYPHSMEVSYVKPSKDAAIATGSKDLVFTNNKEYPIYIEGTTNGYEVSFTIYGKEDRPSNRKVEYISVEDKRIPSYAIEVPDASIPSGTYRSGGGSNHDEVYSHLEKVVYENGQEVSRETLHSDHYAASNETVYVGTGAAAPTDGT